ncbi:HAD family hydrolase [Desulfovibrio sp. JC022]|uniref:HAD family hydrolase n=1 Tax=Desulfovibrio sp. JC022 TaxID=2593642 RepID=UPI0013D09504|nr:HAD family hydrolase [Desulfovibrio sp. JC022]NDV23285.1 HAD family hydrolase [Desulfovibrio sp. JC022]
MECSLDFSAVIFDLDGTLLDTLGEIAAAGNAALTRMGFQPHPVDAYRTFVGAGAKKLAWRALPEDKRTDEVYETFVPVLLEEFDKGLNTIAKPYAGIPEVLADFASCGKKMAVLSNKPHEFTIEAVNKFLPDVDFFEVYGGRKDVPLKPEPDVALELAKAMGAAPQQTLFIGDSDVDIKTGINAGMISIGAGWGFRGESELVKAGANIVLDTPADLVSLL